MVLAMFTSELVRPPADALHSGRLFEVNWKSVHHWLTNTLTRLVILVLVQRGWLD